MAQQRVTYCRICESLCGLVATVDGDEVIALRPDPDNPISRGFACPKGIAMRDVHASPERIVTPQRRNNEGRFESVSWDVAFAEIGERLRAVRSAFGEDAIGVYLGNPSAFSYSCLPWVKGMMDALGSKHFYSASSQDTNSRFVANAISFGSPLIWPVPDLLRTDYLLMLGANPLVSHGSAFSGTLAREALTDIVDRGGRVVVVDPRRTETARLFEHVSIRPNGDAWFLLALLNTIFEEGLHDEAAAAGYATGVERLRAAVRDFTPELAETHSGVPAEVTRTVARDAASAPSAAFYGRVGVCTGPFGTLVNLLLDALAAVTGNLDRPGGTVFPTPPIDLFKPIIKRGLDTVGTWHTRVGGLPEVLGAAPAGVMADEIRTPGPGQLKAVVVVSGNPVLSVPEGRDLESAMRQLDLLVAIDIGFNDTNRNADYVLPATTFLERADMGVMFWPFQLRPYAQWTDPVVSPRGDAREEWTILRDLSAELGLVPNSVPAIRRLGAPARRIGPRVLFDAMLRLGPYGDRFGLRRGGLSVRKLRANPHGIALGDYVETDVLADRLNHSDHRVHVGSDQLVAEVQRLTDSDHVDPDFPMRLFGRRELRSINSWMKNAKKLTAGEGQPACSVHPEDARKLGLVDGGFVRIRSRSGAVETLVEITDDVTPGSVCLPHGWGNQVSPNGTGNGPGGPDFNSLTRAGPDNLEQLSGMSVLNGVHVRLEHIPAFAGSIFGADLSESRSATPS